MRGASVRNETPYLVPIVGDWPNRPGGHPWNPHGTSWTWIPTGGLLAGRSRAARCLAGSSRRLPGAQQLGGVRRHMDQDVHADDIDGGCVRVGAPRRERHPRSFHLGRVRRCRSSGEHRARLAVSLRLHRPGLIDSGSHAVTGRRLLLHLRHREPGAARHPHSCATWTRNTQRVATPSVGHTGRSPGRHPQTPCPPTRRRPTDDIPRWTTTSTCSRISRLGGSS